MTTNTYAVQINGETLAVGDALMDYKGNVYFFAGCTKPGSLTVFESDTGDATLEFFPHLFDATILEDGKPVKQPALHNATRRNSNPVRAMVVTVHIPENPKRGASAQRFALYRNGMTVQQFLEAGGTMEDVRWDVAHSFISIE